MVLPSSFMQIKKSITNPSLDDLKEACLQVPPPLLACLQSRARLMCCMLGTRIPGWLEMPAAEPRSVDHFRTTSYIVSQ